MPFWTPPEGDRNLGLGFYLTDTPGIPAQMKRVAEDFRVTEISAHPVPDPAGPFTILRVVSRDWEQHELSRRLARELHLPPNAIRWAGTKDRRAVAERLASYRGPPPERPLDLPGVQITDAYRSRDGLVLGHHFGNSFEVRLSMPHVDGDRQRIAADSTRSALRGLGGFANLFGPQRFGEVRPVTHSVGRALVRGSVEEAVEIYLTAIPAGGDTLGVEARRSYATHRDPARALREFPPQFSFERQMLEHLARGQSSERALRSLARELRLLFVHAYQSWLFNRWLTGRRVRGLPLDRPVPGDWVLRTGRDGTVVGRDAAPVSDANLDEVVETVGRGGARLAGPLVGFDTPALHGPSGEILEEILREEGVSRDAFRLPNVPELASAGSWRPAWVSLPSIELAEHCDPTRPDGEEHGLVVRFALPKGSYATVLLREFLKPGAVGAGGKAPEPV